MRIARHSQEEPMGHRHTVCSRHRTRSDHSSHSDQRSGGRLMAVLAHAVPLGAFVIAAVLAPQAVARPDLLVADLKTGFTANDDRIVRFDSVTGEFLGEFVPAGGPLDGPTDLVFGP